MNTEKPLVDKDYILFKIGGKGGWTFVEIPEIPMPKTSFLSGTEISVYPSSRQ